MHVGIKKVANGHVKVILEQNFNNCFFFFFFVMPFHSAVSQKLQEIWA